MASKPHGGVAVLAVRPEFAKALVQGIKRVEFRRRPFARPVSYVVIYATSPIKAVIGYFEVSSIEVDAPLRLWQKYRDVGQVSEGYFSEYFRGVERGVAIGVDRVWPLDVPVSLVHLDPNLVAPQSFSYVSPNAFARLHKRTHGAFA